MNGDRKQRVVARDDRMDPRYMSGDQRLCGCGNHYHCWARRIGGSAAPVSRSGCAGVESTAAVLPILERLTIDWPATCSACFCRMRLASRYAGWAGSFPDGAASAYRINASTASPFVARWSSRRFSSARIAWRTKSECGVRCHGGAARTASMSSARWSGRCRTDNGL